MAKTPPDPLRRIASRLGRYWRGITPPRSGRRSSNSNPDPIRSSRVERIVAWFDDRFGEIPAWCIERIRKIPDWFIESVEKLPEWRDASIDAVSEWTDTHIRHFPTWWAGHDRRNLEGEQEAFDAKGGWRPSDWRTPAPLSELAFRPLNVKRNGTILIRPAGTRNWGLIGWALPKRTYEIQGGDKHANYNWLGLCKRGPRIEPLNGPGSVGFEQLVGHAVGFTDFRKFKLYLALCLILGKNPAAALVGTETPPVDQGLRHSTIQEVPRDHPALNHDFGGLAAGSEQSRDAGARPDKAAALPNALADPSSISSINTPRRSTTISL